jgi:phosphoglycolate phosphatase
MYKLAIFDLDGTLINSIGDITDSANAVLNKHGDPTFPEEHYRKIVGWGLEHMVREIVPIEKQSRENIKMYCCEYRDYYRENWHNRTAPYLGISEILTNLYEKGVQIAVLSNKRDDFTDLCVKNFFSYIQFVDIRGERPGIPPKPDPCAAIEIAQKAGVAPSECVFIGDSEIDIQTAINASMFAVGVLWGYRDKRCLDSAGADLTVTAPAELLALF